MMEEEAMIGSDGTWEAILPGSGRIRIDVMHVCVFSTFLVMYAPLLHLMLAISLIKLITTEFLMRINIVAILFL
jgi:hypothetical protein